jgi:hypothetical protein
LHNRQIAQSAHLLLTNFDFGISIDFSGFKAWPICKINLKYFEGNDYSLVPTCDITRVDITFRGGQSMLRVTLLTGAVMIALMIASTRAQAAKAAKCVTKNGEVDHTSADGSKCETFSDGTDKATAKASGDSLAGAEAETGSKADTTATSGSTAESDAFDGATASCDASKGSFCRTLATSGVAKATAGEGASFDSSGGAYAQTDAKCKATAKATGVGALASADCKSDGSVVKATATNGGKAEGFDYQAPICTPNGGTAVVVSPMGNCK